MGFQPVNANPCSLPNPTPLAKNPDPRPDATAAHVPGRDEHTPYPCQPPQAAPSPFSAATIPPPAHPNEADAQPHPTLSSPHSLPTPASRLLRIRETHAIPPYHKPYRSSGHPRSVPYPSLPAPAISSEVSYCLLPAFPDNPPDLHSSGPSHRWRRCPGQDRLYAGDSPRCPRKRRPFPGVASAQASRRMV